MRRLAAPALLLLALLGAALWIGPRLLDWEPYRERLADLASALLERPVALDGPITLVLLPQPRLEAGTVAIGPAGDGITVSARTMRLRLDLGALLAGRLEPREISLVGGEIRLPWPPFALPSFRPPPWLTALNARLEDCRLLVGGLRLDGLNATLVTGGAAEAMVAEGSFGWHGTAVRFSGQLGRAGFDGIAPLDLTLAAVGATLAARGILAPGGQTLDGQTPGGETLGGGFEGTLDAAGTDIAALLPAPPGPFRARGRLTATADLLAADDLTLDLDGQPARGAATLRLAPDTRLDIALAASRLDLDAWVAALRQRGSQTGGQAGNAAVPVSIDLSAETTSFGPLPLRRLRGAFFLDGARLTLSDVSALLPGDTELEIAGATAGTRIELAVRFAGQQVRETLAALGLPLGGTEPSRLRAAEGRFKLVLQDSQATISDLAASIDGSRLSGAGVVRTGGRLAIGLGLTIDRLDLDGLLPPAAEWGTADWPALAARAAGFDLNLRVAAEHLNWHGITADRGALDATLEGGRLALRRLALRLGEVDLAASGSAVLGTASGSGVPSTATRFPDLSLEISGPNGAALAALVPPDWPRAALVAPALSLGAAHAVALRLSGGGVPEALALRAEGDLGELRLEAAASLDVPNQRGVGTLTLRHPGAPRLLAPLLGRGAGEWLGEGSFSLIAGLNGALRPAPAAAATPPNAAPGPSLGPSLGPPPGAPPGLTLVADHLDVVAGGLRARGQLSLAAGPARPVLSGRLVAERLPLPGLDPGSPEPLALGRLGAFDAELGVEVARVEPLGGAVLEQLSGSVRLAAGTLRLEGMQARLGGGTLRGGLTLDGAATPPRLTVEAQLTDATIAEPLFGLPLDLGAGRAEAAVRVEASGHSPAALVATLEGTLDLGVRDGVLQGLDLGALQAAAMEPELILAEAGLRRALAGGATGFERLEVAARLAEGRAALTAAGLLTEGGAAATATGSVDFGRGTLDLRLAARPVQDAPPVGLRLTGPVAAPVRLPELAPFLIWKAQQ